VTLLARLYDLAVWKQELVSRRGCTFARITAAALFERSDLSLISCCPLGSEDEICAALVEQSD
jgi:hypothetical protein